MLGPNITELRSWDRKLLRRYSPSYHAIESRCFLCARGPYDLSERRGGCGQTLETYLARISLLDIGSPFYLSSRKGVGFHPLYLNQLYWVLKIEG